MSTPDTTPRSRRRFLADLLFLGGGLSAVALLAQSGATDPARGGPTPNSPPDSPNRPVAPGEMIAPPPENPSIDGDVAMPEATPACQKGTNDIEPQLQGEPKPPPPQVMGPESSPPLPGAPVAPRGTTEIR